MVRAPRAPLFEEASDQLAKISHILDLLEQFDESQATLKLAARIPVAIANPNPHPNPNPDDLDIAEQVRYLEVQVKGCLKEARELAKEDFTLLLKNLLKSGGLKAITIGDSESEKDNRMLELFARSLMSDASEEDEEAADKQDAGEGSKEKKSANDKQDAGKGSKQKKSAKARVLRKLSTTEEAEEESSSVSEWLRARAGIIGQHATACIDRSLGFGTNYAVCEALKKVTGGTIKALLEETRGLQDALKESCKVNGVGVDGDGETQQ